MKYFDKIEDLKNRLRRSCRINSISPTKRLDFPNSNFGYLHQQLRNPPVKKSYGRVSDIVLSEMDRKIVSSRIRLVVIKTTRLCNRRRSASARNVIIDSLRRLKEPACSITVSSPRTLDMSQIVSCRISYHDRGWHSASFRI